MCCFFFFFQAEDGIRDHCVTGVQTCALPISLGAIFELTDGDVKIEQLFCQAEGPWAAEWENAVLGRDGKTLEAKNVFVYEFAGDRIADLWMICTAPAGSESFWD